MPMEQLLCAACLALQAAINSGNVDGATDLFATNAVVIQPRIGGMSQVYVGRDQIRWWLTNLTSQHASIESIGETQPSWRHVRWPERLSIDTYRSLGLDQLELEADLVLDADGRIESFTTVLTPTAARHLAGSLE
jgi:hypothetical protein